jgi:hypothetical protein
MRMRTTRRCLDWRHRIGTKGSSNINISSSSKRFLVSGSKDKTSLSLALEAVQVTPTPHLPPLVLYNRHRNSIINNAMTTGASTIGSETTLAAEAEAAVVVATDEEEEAGINPSATSSAASVAAVEAAVVEVLVDQIWTSSDARDAAMHSSMTNLGATGE